MRPPVETDVHRLFRGYFAGRTVRGNRYGQDRREARHPRQGHAVATWMALRRSELYLRVAFRIPKRVSQGHMRLSGAQREWLRCCDGVQQGAV